MFSIVFIPSGSPIITNSLNRRLSFFYRRFVRKVFVNKFKLQGTKKLFNLLFDRFKVLMKRFHRFSEFMIIKNNYFSNFHLIFNILSFQKSCKFLISCHFCDTVLATVIIKNLLVITI